MKIDARYKVYNIAGEHVIMQPGTKVGDNSKVIALNDTSLMLWNEMHERQFTTADVAALLMQQYEVDEPTAARDAGLWVTQLREIGLIVD